MLNGLLLVLFFSCFAAQLYAWRHFRQPVRFQVPTPGQILRPVSIIVCGRDALTHLKQNLSALIDQDYSQFEVIVVDHASSDGSYEWLVEMARSNDRLRPIHLSDNRQGKKFALQLGIKEARHEWLCLTDADCRPATRHWLTHMVSRLQSPVDIVAGPAPLFGKGLVQAFAAVDCALIFLQYGSAIEQGQPYMASGRNLAYLKSTILEHDFVGDNQLAGGDDDLAINDLSHRHQMALCDHPDAHVFSEAPKTWKHFYRAKRRHVATAHQYTVDQKLRLAGFAGTHWALLATGILLVISAGWQCLASLTLLSIRWISLYRMLRQRAPLFIQNVGPGRLVLSDLTYLVHYPVLAFLLSIKAPSKW